MEVKGWILGGTSLHLSKSVLLQSVLEVFSNEEDPSSHPAETSGSRKWEKELFGTFFLSTAVI